MSHLRVYADADPTRALVDTGEFEDIQRHLGAVGVRWARTTVLPSRVGLKAHTAASPNTEAIFCRLRS
jgi:hypothetical protein